MVPNQADVVRRHSDRTWTSQDPSTKTWLARMAQSIEARHVPNPLGPGLGGVLVVWSPETSLEDRSTES